MLLLESPKNILNTLLFDRATRRNRKDPYEEKRNAEPYTFNFKKLLKALYHKEDAAQSEVDFFLENSAKKWQTRKGTYQIKRQRLKSDVRDPSAHMVADIDMADI